MLHKLGEITWFGSRVVNQIMLCDLEKCVQVGGCYMGSEKLHELGLVKQFKTYKVILERLPEHG